ncbi:MAG TPA: hypothetical protein VN634_11805 [Candidatus Limnocylindrales bacterium]|nr:hypothetical protein [Candidatus Limnocylindrales bacterium]
MHVSRSLIVSAAAIALSIFAAARPAVAADAEACRSKQIGAAGKACSSVLGCYSKAAKSSAMVDSTCVIDAQVKFGGKLDKAEDALSCDFENVDTDANSSLSGMAFDVSDGELAYTVSACASKKIKAAAKKCKALLKCYSTAAKASTPFAPDADCVTKAATAMTDAFAKIDLAETCVPADRSAEVAQLVDDAAADIVELFTHGPGTPTTLPPDNTAPTITSVSLTPATAYTDTTLTCTPNGGFDADGDTITYTYSWTVNLAPISATTSTLGGSSFAKGDSVSCTVTPTDGTADGAALTSNTVTIGNTAPAVTSAAITPTDPQEASTLTCTPSGTSDADGDTVTFGYSWKKNGTTIGGQTASTLTGASFNKGDIIQCVVTPNDGTDAGSAVTSDMEFIENTPATLTSVSLTPTTAFESSTMTCTPNGFYDADGDSPSYIYFWEVSGSGVPGQNSSTLTGTYFNAGDTVDCYMFVGDGEEVTPIAYISNVVTIH